MKKLVTCLMLIAILFTALPSCLHAGQNTTDDREQSQMSGQERAGLITAIKVTRQAGKITGAEENILLALINQDKGYPTMLRDYMQDYKAKGRSMDEFVADIYAGKLPKKQ